MWLEFTIFMVIILLVLYKKYKPSLQLDIAEGKLFLFYGVKERKVIELL